MNDNLPSGQVGTAAAGQSWLPPHLQGKLFCSIFEAGQLMGARTRASAYSMAARGAIKTVAFGNRRLVPIAWLLDQAGIGK